MSEEAFPRGQSRTRGRSATTEATEPSATSAASSLSERDRLVVDATVKFCVRRLRWWLATLSLLVVGVWVKVLIHDWQIFDTSKRLAEHVVKERERNAVTEGEVNFAFVAVSNVFSALSGVQTNSFGATRSVGHLIEVVAVLQSNQNSLARSHLVMQTNQNGMAFMLLNYAVRYELEHAHERTEVNPAFRVRYEQ
jgi:hypothetical protein